MNNAAVVAAETSNDIIFICEEKESLDSELRIKFKSNPTQTTQSYLFAGDINSVVVVVANNHLTKRTDYTKT
jgi:hypothetical protein